MEVNSVEISKPENYLIQRKRENNTQLLDTENKISSNSKVFIIIGDNSSQDTLNLDDEFSQQLDGENINLDSNEIIQKKMTKIDIEFSKDFILSEEEFDNKKKVSFNCRHLIDIDSCLASIAQNIEKYFPKPMAVCKLEKKFKKNKKAF